MRKHPIWITLGHDKGDLCAIDTLSKNGTRRRYTGKILGWTPENQIVIETLVTEDGQQVRKSRALKPENVQRAHEADRAEHARQRRANTPKATQAQIQYAGALLERMGAWEWHNTDMGHLPMPTDEDLASMTRHEISDLIDDLKEEMA